MYRILFYENKRGENPVLEYIEKLALRDDKDSRIKFDNVMDCIDQLRVNGTRAPEKFVKHVDGEILGAASASRQNFVRGVGR